MAILAPLLSISLECPAMTYVVESLPAKVALAIPAFVALTAGGSTTFASKDLVLGGSREGVFFYGLADPRVDPAAPWRPEYLAELDVAGQIVRRSGAAPHPTRERIVPGTVARALVVAIQAHADTKPTIPLSTIAWRVQDQIVTVMFAPARAENERQSIRGGGTSLGREVNYAVDTRTFQIVRTGFAR